MTITERIAAFKTAYPKWSAAWPHLVREQGRDVLYATWLIGNDYRATSKIYGSYPPGYLARVQAMFPDAGQDLLHAFSGAMPSGPYSRLDIADRDGVPDLRFHQGTVYDAPAMFGRRKFRLIVADPPYSAADAAKYETATVDRRRAIAALARVTRVGGHLVWLDTVWPMHRKSEWLTVGRIAIVRSTNHRVRMATIFERTAA